MSLKIAFLRPNPLLKHWPVFTRPFFLFPSLPANPFSPLFLGTFSPLSPPWKVLCSVEERAQRRAWRGGSFRMDLSPKFGKEIPSRNLRGKRSEHYYRRQGSRKGVRVPIGVLGQVNAHAFVKTTFSKLPLLSAPKSRDSLRLRRRFLPLPEESRDVLRPQDARFPLRRKPLANRDFFCDENW